MKIKVFISSVQKELEDERLAMQVLLTTDPFLAQHCVPILFEIQPAPLSPNSKQYLELLNTCQVYVGVIWKQYGNSPEGISPTHLEYKSAQENNMPILIAIKGSSTLDRSSEAKEFIEGIRKDGHKYDRFNNIEELQSKVRERLIKHIKDTYHIEPTADQERMAKETIQVASAFERQRLDLMNWNGMDKDLAKELVSKAEEIEASKLSKQDILHSLWERGYLWKDDNETYLGTAAGILLLGKDPSKIFVHVRVQVAAYASVKKTHNPMDHNTIRKPLSLAIDESVVFIKKNTRHPLKVVGMNRVEVDEYPEEAIREALVNALAHRNYEDASRRIELNVFKDRIEITSPGELPGGLTITKLLSGQAKSRSRNPNIAQGLNLLGRMEERGTGIQRMTDAMLNHGLDKPKFKIDDGELVVILFGPGDDMDRIKVPIDMQSKISLAVENKLNIRQKEMAKMLANGEKLTSRYCEKKFKITRETTSKDFKLLVELGIAEPQGSGRSRSYVYKG